jgi:tetratricopeptide (TPR) repeat protein
MIVVSGASTESMTDTGTSSKDDLRKKLHLDLRSSQVSPSDVQHPLQSNDNNANSAHQPNEGSDEVDMFLVLAGLDQWLEHVDPTAIELAQQLLSRPSSVKERALPSITKDSGMATISTSMSLNDLQKDAFAKSRPSTASHFLQRSISIANGYNAKGIDKARLGQWEEALSCWNSALEIRTQVLTDTHVDVANTCNNIGIALGKLNRFSEAIASLHRALDIRIQHNGGPEHAQVAATLHNIGNVYQQTGDLESAIQYFCQCKVLQETIFGGSDHVEVARSCVALGHTYFQGDALLDAREAYMDALAIFNRVGLPRNNPEVQTTLLDIRDLDKKIGLQNHRRLDSN